VKRIIWIRRFVLIFLSAAVVSVVASRRRRQSLPPPDVTVAVSPAEVRVKAVQRNAEPVGREVNTGSSRAVAILCGMDEATADRYEARNDALRSIARRRDLPKGDIDALMAYLRRADDAMRVERVAALKNDVMNLLRNQDPPAEGLVETLIAVIKGNNINNGKNNFSSSAHNRARDKELAGGCPRDEQSCYPSCSSCFPSQHPSVVIDYCIQHLGAMVNELDDAMCSRVREVFVRAAGDTTKPYAGTALYSLAEDRRATVAQEGELKRLTLALCKPGVNNVARIAAIQLAGQRGYAEVLPILRETLSGSRRDAVLDTVCIGSIGLLGNADDIALIERFKGDARRSAAVEAAIKRIKGREDIETPTAGKMASLPLRPLLRAVQPHEICSDSFGGLGAVPPDKENIVGGSNRGFATRS